MTTTRQFSGLDWRMIETQSYRCHSVFCKNTNCCCKKAWFAFCYTFNAPCFFIPKALIIYSSDDNEIIKAKCSLCNHKWRFVIDRDLQSLNETWQHMDAHRTQLTEIATQLSVGMYQDDPCPLQYLTITDLKYIFTFIMGDQN